MARTGRRSGPGPLLKLYYLMNFLIVSVLAGVLIAGLAAPGVGIVTVSGAAIASQGDRLAQSLSAHPQFQRSKILMADGSVLAYFYQQNRVYVPMANIAKVMQQAQVDIEDRRYYTEGAVDLIGLARAAVRNFVQGENQGGSTITQQYVKQVRLQLALEANDPKAIAAATENTMERKIQEVQYALGISKALSKDEILERYLNIVYYGDGAYGVQAAAEHFFGTDAAHLTLAQAAMLAGLVQNPVSDNPLQHPASAIQRRKEVLEAMVSAGTITAADAAAANAEPYDPSKAVKVPNGCQSSRYPFVCDYIQRTLVSDAMPGLGANPAERLLALQRGGYTIQTKIDPTVQDAAQGALSGRIDPRDPVVATVVQIDPRTGELVAMAQSRPVMGKDGEAGETYYNYAVETSMGGTLGFQGGSTFKTFTMAAALNQGMDLNTTINVPFSLQLKGLTFQGCSGPFKFNQDHTVNNDAQSQQGDIGMTQAIASSVNTWFTLLEQRVGICQAVEMAKAAGVQRGDGKDMITDPPHYDQIPSFTLGTVEATPLSMTAAYATFANRGIRCDPVIMSGVTGPDGAALAVPSGNCRQVIEPTVADGVSAGLQHVITEGTGTAAYVPGGYSLAGKTGTVTGATAVWFDGYTPDLACTVMIAVDPAAQYWQDRGITPTLAHLRLPVSGTYIDGFGGSDSAPIWRTVMETELPKWPVTHFVPYGK